MKNAKLYALVAVLTAGNIGFRVANAESGPTPRQVSHLETGDRVESVELDRFLADAGQGAESCRLVVAFNPDCPFCKEAAERERVVDREGAYGETLWITDQERPRLGAFAAGLAEGSRHGVAPEAFEALDVEAVPALFMIDRQGVVHWVGPYRGDESSEELASRCDGSAGGVQTVSRETKVADR